MAMLGATPAELIELSSRLGVTTTEINHVSGDTQGIAARVVDEMHGTFATAVSSITSAMDALRGTVDASRGQLETTTWTGANRAVFDGAYTDFTGAMGQLELAVTDAYAEFDAQMQQLSTVIEGFQGQVASSLDQAQTSTTSMAQAVDAQRDNLEVAMNSGISVG